MGVPKFFRYTSERYPCLNELVKQYQIPDFDCMYLDMNGIIHNCSHPDDSNPHFRITEQKIFEDIFHYLSILFQIIKPRKLFFMAIDGVAPRAKMNQQRGRRFRSAREAEELEKKAQDKGEVLPTEKRFDSNCITPGTVFMARLQQQLRYFVKNKISTDPLWSKVKVILSGQETPGEGEHKIMDYIRWARSQPDYDPNTRHCLYGLDADLIMLGMCSHEPHFALLREEVKFGKTTQRATSPEDTNFYLLHLSLLKEYLEQEFISMKGKLSFPFDIEKIVDDWVLMGFLVGNDFIPNLPNMHISNDALPVLYKTYMTVLPTLDGYINENGVLNLRRFEVFMQELAKIDKEKFQDTYADLKYFEGKTGRRPNAMERKEYKPNNDDTFNVDIDDIKSYKPDDELQALINATKDMFMDDVEDYNEDDDLEIDTSDEEATFNMEFIQHKKDYYMNKLDYSKVTDEVLASQAEGYVRAIQWNLFYYYRGCPSWCWYYPHHYAPYMSDIKGFADLEITFELGVPFKPFEQLLAVLPSASKHLLPTPFQTLMTEEESPIIHYYPINFETDLNGKKNDWEAVVLIPFIDEGNLLTAMEPCYQRLTEDELDRNKHGPMYVYNWTKNNLGISLAPEYFPAIKSCHASETPLYRESLIVPLQQLKQGPLPNATRDKIYPGFPTMRHLDYTTELKKCKVKVFDQPSRNENMMVSIVRENKPEPSIEDIAEDILGRTIWVGWPHLARAKVISVSNEQKRLHLSRVSDSGEVSFTTEMNFGNLHKQWISERSTVIEHNMNRLGIILGDITTLVHAVSIKGYKYAIEDNNSMVLDTEWCQIPCGYAYQAVLKQVQAHVVQSQGRFTCLEEAFPKGDKVFLMAPGQYYGCQAEVTESESIRSGRIKVQIEDRPQPKPKNIRHSESTYKAAHHAAPTVGITKNLFTRVTGCVLVVFGERVDCPTEGMPKVNLGLNLKFNSKNQEISGYTRRCAVTNNWLYSERCVQLVASFVQQFPQFFDRLSIHQRNDVFFEGELFPGEVGKGKPQEISTWLKAQSFNQCPRRECGSEALEPEELLMMSKDVDSQLELMKGKEKIVSLAVKWNLLYKSELHEGNIAPDPNADFKMYDRVVNVANNITVPLGAEGTITAIYKSSTGNTVRLSDRLNAEPSYQVLFDQPFSGAMKEDLFEEHRLYRMLPSFLLNISFGRKLRNLVSEPSDAQNKGYTNVLKRDDGNSAFANYSPTKQKKPPAMDNRITAETKCANIFAEDNGTELLKSLLQISEKDTSKNKKGPPQNWRMKPDDGILPTPQNKPQKPSWRIETNQASSSGPPNNRNVKNFPPAPQFANMPPPQLPIPAQIPFPRFQTQAMPLPTQPRLPGNFNQPNLPNNKQVYNNQTKNFFSQPAFANQPNMFGNQHGNLVPQFQQPNLSNPRQEIGNAQNICNVANQPQNVSKNPGNSVNQQRSNQVGNQPNGIFPKHLPNVEADAPNVINPSKNQSNDSRDKTKNSVDKLINPFVPLQVQTSQRCGKKTVARSHLGIDSSLMSDTFGKCAAVDPVQNRSYSQWRNKPPSEPTDVKKQAPANAVKPVAVHPSTQNNAQSTSSKKNEPKAKRKPRIAANLPFPTD